MDFDNEIPDVDNLDAEISFEGGYRALRRELVTLFEERDGFIHIGEITTKAKHVLAGIPEQGNIILATLKAMLRDKVIRKVDNDQFCNYDRPLQFRSIDDTFAAYVYRPEVENPQPKPPNKKQIINDVARVAREFPYHFTMGQLAKAWSKSAPKEYINALKKVFGISPEIKSSGKRIFLEIMQKLVDDKIIEPYQHGDDEYRAVAPKLPKQERFRSLDDDWL